MSYAEIDVDELARLLDAGAALVDVRQPGEWEEARITGATLIPLAELPDRTAELPDAESLVLICRSGARSARACEFLAAQGFETANVAGGILAWIDSGR
jgi:rhodanese-related sulfurtransferase